ncbi:hypothetical protein ACHQM5_012500 [Ranunculus cassubicifolius]
MAFHLACPITCQRICFCELGFPLQIGKKEGFLEEICRVEEFLDDPLAIKGKENGTVQVLVPKVIPPPVPAATVVDVVTASVATPIVVEGFGNGGGDVEEMLSIQSKRIALQKKAVAASIAAEDYARKFETGALIVSGGDGEAIHDIVGEDQGVKVMCRICFDGENEGSERANRMLPCKLCNKKYHRSCLKIWGLNRDLFHLSSWVCPLCRSCEVCRKPGDATKFMFCKRCDDAYHCYCLPFLYKKVSNGPYLCPKHTRCHSCGSNVPGNGPSTRWFLGYTCCDACGRLFVKGNYCPVCLKVYRDSESTPMVCCDACERWVHCQCDGISDEKYLQFQADDNLYYKCTACRGECYQVTGPDDAVQELWRRRDIADRDQMAILRASAGLPSEEVSISDDDDYSPVVKNESGRSLKFSVKGSSQKGTKNPKESGKKMSSKKFGKKKGPQVSFSGHTDAYETYEGLHSRESNEFHVKNETYRSEGVDLLLLRNARNLGNTKEKCSVNQAGVMRHEFVAKHEDRGPKISQMKSNKSHDPVLGFGYGKHSTSKPEEKKKLVIHFKNKNLNNSPKSEASGYHREQDITASNGSEDGGQKVKKKHAYERNDMTSKYYDGKGSEDTGQKVHKKHSFEKSDRTPKFYDGKGEKSGKLEQQKYSRNREHSVIKLGRVTGGETSDINPKIGKGIGAAASTWGTEEVPLKRHSKSEIETQDSKRQKVSDLEPVPKDPKPLLKLKFKNRHVDSRSCSSSSPLVASQEEDKSSIKGQRSKRKRPEKSQLRQEEEEEEEEEEDGNTQEVKGDLDANWILKKLGKDAIGKRVEVQRPSDGSWHKGEVSDMIDGTSNIVVSQDDGRIRTLDLGKQAIRFAPLKQK